MDCGPLIGPELYWLLGFEPSDGLLENLTDCLARGYLDWVVIPGASCARSSTADAQDGTFVP